MSIDPKKRVPAITDVQSSRTRDLLRGLLTRHPDANTRATFRNLMAQVSGDDLPVVDCLLRENALFGHLSLREEFPKDDLPFFETSDLTLMPRDELRIPYILSRADKNSSYVAGALVSFSMVNEAIFVGRDEDILASFDITLEAFGHSLAIARKLAFVLGYAPRESRSWQEASKWFAAYGLSARNFGMMAVADSIGDDFSYLDIRRAFDHYLDITARSSTSQKVSYLSFYPFETGLVAFQDSLSACYSLGLIDAVFYLLVHREMGVVPAEIRFAEEIENAWRGLQAPSYDMTGMFGRGSPTGDARAFRSAPAFLEIERFRLFRASTQRLYELPERRRPPVGSDDYESQFYAGVKTIRDILPEKVVNWDVLPQFFDSRTAGSFSRSCALVKATERDNNFGLLSPHEMGSLMASTMDVDRLLSTSVLRLSADSTDDDFVRLILRTLLRANSPLTRDNYQFKQLLQDFIRARFEESILSFVRQVHADYPEIVGYLISLLDETMLSQLPFLVKTAEDVFETRASLLEWFAEASGDPTIAGRAKQLRIDRKIAAVRGQINETRLNIDSLRFRQWIDSTKLAEFSSLIRQTEVYLPPMSDFRSKRAIAEMRLSAHRDPNARSALAVIDCYKEFCTNPDFGVASYLGRRIRHGTLRGTLLDRLPTPSTFGLSPQSQASFDRWLSGFSIQIDQLLAKLHFAGKGANSAAIISPEVDTKEKWSILVNCLIALHERAQEDQGVALIPLIVEQYCWFILEEELKSVQSAILESRVDFGTFRLRHQASESGASGFEKAVNMALSQRFATVASWFKKPPNISPVASLSDIIKVILQEAQAEFSDFNPSLQLGVGELQLSGSVYYNIYDALSVIVRNAAKHGARPGTLSIAASSEERERGTMLRLAVTTVVRQGDSAAAAIARMQMAELKGAKDADVVEGLSGMRKLAKMRLDRRLLEAIALGDAAKPREVTVSVAFPLTGLV